MDRRERIGPLNTHHTTQSAFQVSLKENSVYIATELVIIALTLADPMRSDWEIKLFDRKACFPRNPSHLGT